MTVSTGIGPGFSLLKLGHWLEGYSLSTPYFLFHSRRGVACRSGVNLVRLSGFGKSHSGDHVTNERLLLSHRNLAPTALPTVLNDLLKLKLEKFYLPFNAV